MTTVFTIGHSNHTTDEFVELLACHSVQRLVDVRSQPFSRRHPNFCRRALERDLAGADIEYLFMGDTLGGRPPGDEFRLADGRVDYRLRSGAADFLDGIERLAALTVAQPTAIMCAEEDPSRCHRRLLIAPALLACGLEIVHIRGDARVEPESAGDAGQLSLFG